jgi:hypothetical protein
MSNQPVESSTTRNLPVAANSSSVRLPTAPTPRETGTILDIGHCPGHTSFIKDHMQSKIDDAVLKEICDWLEFNQIDGHWTAGHYKLGGVGT